MNFMACELKKLLLKKNTLAHSLIKISKCKYQEIVTEKNLRPKIKGSYIHQII